MYCGNCGNRIPDHSAYCPRCGATVRTEPVTPAVREIREAEPAEPVTYKNGIAVAGFVFAFLAPLLGILLSAIGLSRASSRGGKNKELAIAGIIIGIVLTVVYIYLFFTVVLPLLVSIAPYLLVFLPFLAGE